MLQLSCLLSSYNLPVFFVGSALHNRQARARVNALNPQSLAQIHFHDFPTPPFLLLPTPTPPPISPPISSPLRLRRPFAAFLQKTAQKFTRVVVLHDFTMSFVVQDVAETENAESYEFVGLSAFSQLSIICGYLGLPFPVPHPTELPPFQDWMSDEFAKFAYQQSEPYNLRSGHIYNTSRVMEAPYLQALEKQDSRPGWAIGPILPKSSPITHECLEWLDKQEPNSVIYVSFGTTVSFPDEQINELARGLAQSGVKFLWVLRDADKGDVFDRDVRRAELPEGFGERDGRMVVREWAPQPQILAHPSIGGFMSHCGWNSCIESITAGVPIAAWPMHTDQPSNAALIADIFKTEIVVREWKDRLEVVKTSRIENVVTRLMVSEEGDQMRKTAEELGATVKEATEPGSASRLELESFIAHINR